MINLKDSAHKIKMQAAALRLLLEGMEAADWTDETPLGVEIFLDHIITEINRLYNALPGEPSGASKLATPQAGQGRARLRRAQGGQAWQ